MQDRLLAVLYSIQRPYAAIDSANCNMSTAASSLVFIYSGSSCCQTLTRKVSKYVFILGSDAHSCSISLILIQIFYLFKCNLLSSI